MFFKILFINWNHGVLILLINWIHGVFFIRLSFKLSDWLNILCTLCTVSLICYLIGWISSGLSLCPATWLAEYPLDCLFVLLTDWLHISLSCYLIGWISLCPATWLAEYPLDFLSVLLPDWLNILWTVSLCTDLLPVSVSSSSTLGYTRYRLQLPSIREVIRIKQTRAGSILFDNY